jgi:hypothetical protein
LFQAQWITSPAENDASMKVKIGGIQSKIIFCVGAICHSDDAKIGSGR